MDGFEVIDLQKRVQQNLDVTFDFVGPTFDEIELVEFELLKLSRHRAEVVH